MGKPSARPPATADMKTAADLMPLLPVTAEIRDGHLWVGGMDLVELARQAGMYLCHRYSGEKLRTIGELFNVRESAISEASRLFPRKMEKDKKLRNAIDRIKRALIV